jgi:hypothetical protein
MGAYISPARPTSYADRCEGVALMPDLVLVLLTVLLFALLGLVVRGVERL